MVQTAARAYPSHDHLLIPYGEKRFWSDPTSPMRLLQRTEAVMQAVNNASKGVKVRWSTAKEYFEAIEGTQQWEYRGDFAPIVNGRGESWTGGYSLASGFKQRIVETQEVGRMAEILGTAVLGREVAITGLSLLLHSDVFSGLGDNEALAAYFPILSHAESKSLDILHESLTTMLQNTSHSAFPIPYRPLLLCSSLNWPRTVLFHFNSPTLNVAVLDTDGRSVKSQAILHSSTGNYTIYFLASLPPLSVNIWAVVERTGDCVDCAKLSTEYTGTTLSAPGSLFTVEFSIDGKVHSISHAEFGTQVFMQDFLSFQDSGTSPFVFNSGNATYAEAARALPLFLSRFTLMTGDLFSAAVTEWTHQHHQFAQLLILPNRSAKVIWEITSSGLEDKDVMVGFRTNDSQSALSLLTFDGFSWTQRFYSPSPHLSSNVFPVSAAFALPLGLSFIPKHPLGVGFTSDSYFFHLRRSCAAGDCGGATHSYTLVWKDRESKWGKEIHELQRADRLLVITNNQVETTEVMDIPAQEEPWECTTSSWLNLDTAEFYLSSLTQLENTKLLRIQPLEDAFELRWDGMSQLSETDLSGHDFPSSGPNKSDERLVIADPQGKMITTDLPFLKSYRVQFSKKVFRNPYDRTTVSLEELKNRREKMLSDRVFSEESEQTEESQPLASLPVQESVPEEDFSQQQSPLHLDPVFLPILESPSLTQSTGLTLLEYGLFASLSLMGLTAISCYFRTQKRRTD